jgi:hypothetical protein
MWMQEQAVRMTIRSPGNFAVYIDSEALIQQVPKTRMLLAI